MIWSPNTSILGSEDSRYRTSLLNTYIYLLYKPAKNVTPWIQAMLRTAV